MPSYSGVWTLPAQMQAVGSGNWQYPPAYGLFGGGGGVGSETNVIDYININTTANAADFGDLTVSRNAPAATGSLTRGVWGGGQNPSGFTNVVEYVTIMSVGNAIDFGDLTSARQSCSATSNGHGGL